MSQNPSSLVESNSVLLNSFKNELKKITEGDEVEVESNLKSKYGDTDTFISNQYVAAWRGLSTKVDMLRNADERIISVSNWQGITTDIIFYARSLIEEDFPNAKMKLFSLRALEGAVSNLMSLLPELPEERGTNYQFIA
jgi:hypothetical protein